MSHYTVLAMITPERIVTAGSVNAALEALLAPYKEKLVFEDIEEEYLEKYNTDGVTMHRGWDGVLRTSWDEYYRMPGNIGTSRNTHVVPESHAAVEVPYREKYATFEEYMKDWCGYDERDADTGRYGSWRNPNAKWDYWRIGGRWRGLLFAELNSSFVMGEKAWEVDHNRTPFIDKPQAVDGVQIKNLSWVKIEAEQKKKAGVFLDAWTAWNFGRGDKDVAGNMFNNKPNLREFALEMGFLTCIHDEKELTGKELLVDPWPKTERAGWDIWNHLPKADELWAEYMDYWLPIRTYAVVNDDGWHEPGEMGWWGCCSGSGEDHAKYTRTFRQFIEKADPDTWLVVCDCHI